MSHKKPSAADLATVYEKLLAAQDQTNRAQLYLRGLVGSANTDCLTLCLTETQKILDEVFLRLELHSCDEHSSIVF